MARMLLTALATITLLVGVAGAIATWRLSRAAEADHPPIGRFIDVEGARLHFVDEGTGPALVLLHGAGGNLRDFEPSLVPALRDRFRLVRVDRPGSGYSRVTDGDWPDPNRQAALVLELLAELGVDEAIWVGHSWGGAVVMAALLSTPERVRGGVLLAGAAYPWAGGVDLTDRLATWPLISSLVSRTVITPLGHLLLDRGIQTVFAPEGPTSDYRERTGVALYLRPDQFAATGRDITNLSPWLEQQATRYHTIEQPLLLVHGSADTIVPAWNHTDRLERLLPQAQVLRMPGVGHAPHHTQTEQVAGRIVRFAESVFRESDRGLGAP